MYAYQWWADTTTGLLKIRNSANSAWVTLFELDGTLAVSDISLGAGTVGAPSLFFTGDSNTGLFSPGADTVALVTGGTNRVHITSGGLVGIGTTGPVNALQVVSGSNYVASFNTSTISASSSAVVIGNYLNGGGGSGGGAIRVYHNHGLTVESSIAFEVNGATERARIDSSGRLLVGLSSSPSLTDGQYSKLHVVGNTNSANGDGFINIGRGALASTGLTAGTSLGNLQFTDSAGAVHAVISGLTDATTGTNDYPGRLVFSTTSDGAASPTERMRITNNGRLIVGYTSSAATVAGTISAVGYAGKQGISNAPDDNIINFFFSGNLEAWVDSTNLGNVTIVSDYRIKKDITSQVESAIPKIKALRPVTYQRANYKELFTEDGIQREGFIAHELASVIPSAVSGEKDAENQIQSLNMDAVVSVLTKALQESIAKIEALETRLSALEAA